MKVLLKLFLLTFLVYSCDLSEKKNNQEGGDCDTSDPYIYEEEGFGVLMEISADSGQIDEQLNELVWHYEYPNSTSGNIYYFDSIVAYPDVLKSSDTLKLLKIEYGHMKGSCGPQMDSVVFQYIE
jgi:hypothetical protein